MFLPLIFITFFFALASLLGAGVAFSLVLSIPVGLISLGFLLGD